MLAPPAPLSRGLAIVTTLALAIAGGFALGRWSAIPLEDYSDQLTHCHEVSLTNARTVTRLTSLAEQAILRAEMCSSTVAKIVAPTPTRGRAR